VGIDQSVLERDREAMFEPENNCTASGATVFSRGAVPGAGSGGRPAGSWTVGGAVASDERTGTGSSARTGTGRANDPPEIAQTDDRSANG
jgi:hypothetical protein